VSRRDVKSLVVGVTDTGDAGSGTWEAVASTDSVDRDGEIVDRWAFRQLPPSVPTHDNHNLNKVVGRCVPRYDARGILHVAGRFSAIPEAQRTRQLVVEGTINAMSVMFHNPTRQKDRDGITHITSGELLAVDFVTVPSQRDALVTSARGFGSRWSDDDPERARLAAWRARIDALKSDLELLPRPSGRGRDARAVRKFYAELADAHELLKSLRRR
jgi:HK97 family phage prohead protease